MNRAPAMGTSVLCSGCNQPIRIAAPAPQPPAAPPNESTALLRDAVRSLRVIAMFVGVCAAFGAALMFGGEGQDAMAWLRRGGIFWLVVFVAAWIVLTRKRIV